MKLIKAELTVGAIVGLVFAVKVGWWALPLAVVTSLLWAVGGAEGGKKIVRRLGVPLAITSACALFAHSWWPFVSVPLAFGVLSIGYGIVTPGVDEGSWLGRLCWKWANKNEKLAELYCRTILYTLLALAFMPCWIS